MDFAATFATTKQGSPTIAASCAAISITATTLPRATSAVNFAVNTATSTATGANSIEIVTNQISVSTCWQASVTRGFGTNPDTFRHACFTFERSANVRATPDPPKIRPFGRQQLHQPNLVVRPEDSRPHVPTGSVQFVL